VVADKQRRCSFKKKRDREEIEDEISGEKVKERDGMDEVGREDDIEESLRISFTESFN
jgi:hypothetical protein